MSNLAEKIMEMSEYCEQDYISKALQIPEDIIRGILDGTIDKDSINDYDPSKPYKVKLVKEDGLKVVEQKLDKIEHLAQQKKTNPIIKIKNLLLDLIWLLALITCVSAAIYTAYSVGQSNGFENELLTKAAMFIQDSFKMLTSLFAD